MSGWNFTKNVFYVFFGYIHARFLCGRHVHRRNKMQSCSCSKLTTPSQCSNCINYEDRPRILNDTDMASIKFADAGKWLGDVGMTQILKMSHYLFASRFTTVFLNRVNILNSRSQQMWF